MTQSTKTEKNRKRKLRMYLYRDVFPNVFFFQSTFLIKLVPGHKEMVATNDNCPKLVPLFAFKDFEDGALVFVVDVDIRNVISNTTSRAEGFLDRLNMLPNKSSHGWKNPLKPFPGLFFASLRGVGSQISAI